MDELFKEDINMKRRINEKSDYNALTRAKEFIKNATTREGFYDKIRAILKDAFIEDWDIKQLQRLADAKYEQLGEVRESYKRRVNESLTGKERVRFIRKMVDKLTKEPFLYSHEEANDIAIRHADNVSKDWGGWEDMDAYIRADLRRILPKKDYDATYSRKNESYKRRIREAREKHIKDLTDGELIALRKEIVLGSLFTRDYENSFDIDAREVEGFFDGFIDWADEEYNERYGERAKDITDIYDEFDNDDDLIEYAKYIEW